MYTRDMIISVLTFLVLISSTAKTFFQITYQEYPMMQFTKFIKKNIINPELPLQVVQLIAGEDSTNTEVGYLIEELHTSGRWPILEHNVSYKMKKI
jgi:hypothetical protein